MPQDKNREVISGRTGEKKALYADIALNAPIKKTYEYKIPQEMADSVKIGSLVKVPVRSRTLAGCVLDISAEKTFSSPKPVSRILTPDFQIPPDLIELARWISEYYFCSIGEALACVSFIGFNDCRRKELKAARLTDVRMLEDPVLLNSLPKRQQDVMEYFITRRIPQERVTDLQDKLGVSYSVIQGLEKKGIVEIIDETIMRQDEYGMSDATDHLDLNHHQARAFDTIKGSILQRCYKTFLLYGITGSGKTEVYLQALRDVMAQGRQGIVLVPEIALTPQTVERFRSRFGRRIGVYHSQLSLGQKYDMWRAIRAGSIQCLVGARSAVFAPFPNLGLIVVDEEHETTYKQSDSPRYHARDVAIMRASRRGAVVILGSATPSLESYYNTKKGKFTLLTLPERIRKISLPKVHLVDMTTEMVERKESGIFSRVMKKGIEKRLEAGDQVILFLNRRGFANFMMCPSCNKVIKCDHCDVTMTYHKVGNRLVCHWCGEVKKPPPEECPYCGKTGLMKLGMGTQRLDEEIAAAFPEAESLRLDSDSMGSRTAFLEKWKKITSGEVDILFGTQILAKGFDLAPVTLVGVISADNSLFLPDFRSSERTFSLLTQVAGRAGRGDRPGEVIIQTYLPKHYSIVDALSQDYSVFAERELANRRALRFPPYYQLASILLTGKKAKTVRERAKRLAGILRMQRDRLRVGRRFWVLGPAPSPISKLDDQYRFRLILRAEKKSDMRAVIKSGLEKFESMKLKGAVRITVDIDPQDLL